MSAAGNAEVSAPPVAELAARLRDQQRPLKDLYRAQPERALTPATAVAVIDQAGVTAAIPTTAGDVHAGLHPAGGGDGSRACSADILLQSLVGCAGVTLAAVATSMGIELRRAEVRADGIWDAKGTLGVDRSSPVGLTSIALSADLDAYVDGEPADEATLEKLLQLTERYCVVAQTLASPPEIQFALASR